MAAKKKAGTANDRRIPEGKKQMLSVLPEDLIAEFKAAVAHDGMKLSGAVDQALRAWLAQRKKRKA